jgi:hypothetical protein
MRLLVPRQHSLGLNASDRSKQKRPKTEIQNFIILVHFKNFCHLTKALSKANNFILSIKT